MLELKEIAKNVMTSCLAVKAGEALLVVTDDSRVEIGRAIYEGAKDLGCEAMLLVMEARKVSGEEPPKIVAEAMKAADVVICPTAQSLTHTHARMEAARAGARIATMPGITETMFHTGAMTAEYGEVEQLSLKIAALLTKAATATVEKGETRLLLDLQGRTGIASTGMYRKPGNCGNLPSGEAYIAPMECGSNGEMDIDGSMVGLGKLNSPLHVVVKNGKLQSVSGEKSEFLGILLQNEQNATLCELGIGTNRAAILSGAILEDEKVYGTVHIAFGTNDSFGGTNKAGCHMDGIILKPTLYLDDTLVMQEGVFAV